MSLYLSLRNLFTARFIFDSKFKYFLRSMKAALASNVHNGDVYSVVMAVAWTILNSVPLLRFTLRLYGEMRQNLGGDAK